MKELYLGDPRSAIEFQTTFIIAKINFRMLNFLSIQNGQFQNADNLYSFSISKMDMPHFQKFITPKLNLPLINEMPITTTATKRINFIDIVPRLRYSTLMLRSILH